MHPGAACGQAPAPRRAMPAALQAAGRAPSRSAHRRSPKRQCPGWRPAPTPSLSRTRQPPRG
eukprot:9105627-Lingulodinium_polyedra.AAC.1